MSVKKIIGFFILSIALIAISEDVFADNAPIRDTLQYIAVGSFIAFLGSIYTTLFNKKEKNQPQEIQQEYIYNPKSRKPKRTQKRFCPECGANLTPPGIFCGKCGTSIN